MSTAAFASPAAFESAAASGPVRSPGASSVSVAGNRLVDGSGTTMRLLGVNRSGTEYACIQKWGIFDGPNDAASVQAMAAWHINAVRVPLNEDCWLGINGVPPAYGGVNYQQAVAAYVGLLNQNGLVAVLDLHWAAPGATPATKQLPMPDSDHSPAFWAQVAAAYGANPSVVFDIFNEPFPDNVQDTTAAWTCLRDGDAACNGLLVDQGGGLLTYSAAGTQSLVNSIRGAGAGNVIMVGGVSYSGSLSQWTAYRPADRLGRIAASWHNYNFNSCITAACWDATVAPVATQAPVVTGEIGEDDCATGYVTGLMNWLDAHAIGYLAWTWDVWPCAGGPALITDYAGTPTAYGVGVRDHLAQLAGAGPGTGISDTLAGVVGSDGALFVKHNAQAYQPLGGALLAAPAVITVPNGSSAPVALFIGEGTDHNLYVRSYGTPWQRLSGTDFACYDSPGAAVIASPGGGYTLTVACEGGDRGLYYAQSPVTASRLPSVGGFTALGGVLNAGPAVASINGTLSFFVTGSTRQVFIRTLSSGYVAQVAACIGHLAVAAMGATAYVACHGTDDQLYYSWSSGSGWSGYQNGGGLLIDGPGLALTSSGATIFVEGTDHAMYRTVVNLTSHGTSGFAADGGIVQYGAGAGA